MPGNGLADLEAVITRRLAAGVVQRTMRTCWRTNSLRPAAGFSTTVLATFARRACPQAGRSRQTAELREMRPEAARYFETSIGEQTTAYVSAVFGLGEGKRVRAGRTGSARSGALDQVPTDSAAIFTGRWCDPRSRSCSTARTPEEPGRADAVGCQ